MFLESIAFIILWIGSSFSKKTRQAGPEDEEDYSIKKGANNVHWSLNGNVEGEPRVHLVRMGLREDRHVDVVI